MPPVPPAQREGRGADSDWIGLGEASRILGISQGTLRRWSDDGRVGVFTTPGGHRRFSRAALRSLLPAARAERPSLARLGASPERIVRAYRPAARRAPTEAVAPWLDALSEADRFDFRERGRAIVEALLAHLDASDSTAARLRLQDACQLAADHGREVARLGASMAEAVQTFLQFRRPFVAALAGIARRRGLDTREATDLLVQAEAAMDQLLVSTMTGHSLASVERRRGHAARPTR
ncbi:MAG TPA: helix-turn-helix domain-containing protein [Candidatus Limnocylindrales bacterium]